MSDVLSVLVLFGISAVICSPLIALAIFAHNERAKWK